MPQSLAALHVHLIFSTKNRESFITPEIEGELFPYMATIFLESHSPATIINGTADHVHCLFSLARTAAVSDVVEQLKRSSSLWIKTKDSRFENFYWQTGYGAFSIGRSQVDEVRQYIAGQKERHRVLSFQDEYRAFLRKYEIEYDERYVWD